jgi:hypothetical protein
MPRAPKRTITRDSVFRKTGGAPTETPAQGIPVSDTPTRQTAVWLADEESEWLDSQCQLIRRGGWRSITRSALIRALIRAAMEGEADLSGVSAERELTERLLRTH